MGFTDIGGTQIVRFRTLSFCSGLLKGFCSKSQRPYCQHSQVILYAHSNTSSLSLAPFCSFSPLGSFSISNFITRIFPESLCRHLNQMSLLASSFFTHWTFPRSCPSLLSLCSPSQFPNEFLFYFATLLTQVSGVPSLPKP